MRFEHHTRPCEGVKKAESSRTARSTARPLFSSLMLTTVSSFAQGIRRMATVLEEWDAEFFAHDGVRIHTYLCAKTRPKLLYVPLRPRQHPAPHALVGDIGPHLRSKQRAIPVG